MRPLSRDQDHPSAPAGVLQEMRIILDQLCDEHGVPKERVRLGINPHMKRAFGYAYAEYAGWGDRHYGKRTYTTKRFTIYMSLQLMMRGTKTQWLGTLRHEFAHIWQCFHFDKLGHDLQFKVFCAKIGGTMNSGHAGIRFAACTQNFDLPPLPASTPKPQGNINWQYKCRCGCIVEERTMRYQQKQLLSRNCPSCKLPIAACEILWVGHGPAPAPQSQLYVIKEDGTVSIRLRA